MNNTNKTIEGYDNKGKREHIKWSQLEASSLQKTEKVLNAEKSFISNKYSRRNKKDKN